MCLILLQLVSMDWLPSCFVQNMCCWLNFFIVAVHHTSGFIGQQGLK